MRSSAQRQSEANTSWPSGSSVATLPTSTSVQSTWRARDLEGVDHALRVLPFVEARDLHHQRQVGRNVVVREAVGDLGLRQFLVGGRERIDRRHDEALRRAELLRVFRQRQHHRVVALDQRREIAPDVRMRLAEIDVAAPDPRRLLAEDAG